MCPRTVQIQQTEPLSEFKSKTVKFEFQFQSILYKKFSNEDLVYRFQSNFLALISVNFELLGLYNDYLELQP